MFNRLLYYYVYYTCADLFVFRVDREQFAAADFGRPGIELRKWPDRLHERPTVVLVFVQIEFGSRTTDRDPFGNRQGALHLAQRQTGVRQVPKRSPRCRLRRRGQWLVVLPVAQQTRCSPATVHGSSPPSTASARK